MAKKRSKAKRRNRGEGSTYQRKDGRWCGQISLRDERGKRTRPSVYGKTKTEVSDKLIELRAKAKQGLMAEPQLLTMEDYLQHWLTTIRASIEESTYGGYETIVRLHITPKLGHLQVSKINDLHIERAMADLAADGLGDRGRQQCYGIIKRSLQKLVPRTLPFNPCENVVRPKYASEEIHPLTQEQAETLIKESSEDRLHALYVLALLSGARQGELFALFPKDIDLESGAIAIRRTLTDSPDGLKFKPPKTKASRRRISIPTRAVTALEEHRKQRLKEGNASAKTFFCASDGDLLSRRDVQRNSFKPLLEDNDLPDIRFHDLRHTHATLLLLADVNPKIVQERLGHSSIAITLDTYSHVLPTMQEKATAALDRMFG